MNVTTNASVSRDRRAATLVMACVGVFVAYLPVTTVSVSLPAIQRSLHASTAQLAWVSDAFVLPMAALILTAGVVGDVHGRKMVFQAGLAFCALGAAIGLSAQSIEVLWIGQAFAGIGAAALLPTTLALISHVVPDPRERGKFIGLWATSLLLALALGPIIAGAILEHFAWRWIFLLAVPVSLVTMVCTARLLTDSRAAGSRRLDWPGQLTAALAITALVYGVIEGGADSFTDEKVMVALFAAVVSGVAFVLVERRSDSPMLDLKLFRSPAFSATTLVAMISFLGLIGFFFALSLYLGMVQQLSTLEASTRLLAVSLMAILVGAPVGRLMHRVSARVLITGGLLVSAGALLSLTTIDADTSYVSLVWRLALLGLGMGLVITPMTATAVASVPHHLAGMAAAGNNAFRQVGGALGPAVLGALLTSRATDSLPGHLAAAGLTGAQRQSVVSAVDEGGLGAVAQMDLGPAQGRALGALSEAFLDGLHLCLIVSAILSLVAAAVAALLLRSPRQATTTPVISSGSGTGTGTGTATGTGDGSGFGSVGRPGPASANPPVALHGTRTPRQRGATESEPQSDRR
ncbi:EmrB/QacA subfamily drug resistance transporter [Streptomyces aurantiacus]|uniref:MFS transporter n=1 Tax=Streptomyces aurantiacus TaxID=47760 RepID=UPI002794648C|nr:MFS transporter [Streptomyces aurantiacus]MDQ0778071.1 EmrB/QacA subfamily drug resistance transporter [Streptomyces aurantiacus]